MNRKLVCGGCTEWSVKGIARECHIGKDSVVEALKKLPMQGLFSTRASCWEWRDEEEMACDASGSAGGSASFVEVMGLPSLVQREEPAAAEEEAMDDVLEACL